MAILQSVQFLILVVTAAILICQPVFSQGYIQGQDKNGIGISGGFSINDSGGSLGTEFTLVGGGIVDIGVGLFRGWADENDGGTDLSSTGVGVGLSLYPVNHTDEIPLSVSLSTAYGRSWFSGDILDDTNTDMTKRFWSFGAGCGVVINAENMKLIPTVGVNYTNHEFTMEQPRRRPTSIDDGVTALSIGLSMAFESDENAVFHVTPEVRVDEENTTFGVTVGVLFVEEPRNGWSGQNRRRKTRPYTTFTPEPQPPSHVRPREPSQPREGTLPFVVVTSLTDGVPMNTAVRVTPQDAAHAESLAQVFKVPPESIRTFRWGNSTAGPGHPHHQTTWFVIEYGDGDYRARETIRIDASGGIIEHVKE